MNASTAAASLLAGLDPAACALVSDIHVLVEPLPGRTVAAAALVNRDLFLVIDITKVDAVEHGLAMVADIARGMAAEGMTA